MTSSFKKRQKRWSSKYKIKTFTPVHIGSGETLEEKADYRIEGEYIEIINQDKLYDKIKEFDDPVEIIEKLKDYLLNSHKMSENLDKIYNCKDIYYQDKIRNQMIEKSPKIFDSVKEDTQYYIPGSSIKGGFRTALLFNQYNNAFRLNKIEERLRKHKKNGKSKKFEYDLFYGNITNEIEKYLGLGGVYFVDSQFIDYSDISVVSVSKFFRDGGKYTKGRTTSNIIAINKNVTIEFEISFDKYEKINYLFDKMNQYILSAVDREIELFKITKSKASYTDLYNKSLEDIIKSLEELKSRAQGFIKDGNKRAVIRIGKEKSFHFNTIHSLLDIETSRDIYEHMVKTPKKETHPLLVSLINEENSYTGMMGWAEISEVGDEVI